MPPPNDLPPDAWMDARVEAYVDDTLPAPERARFDARLRADPHWQDQVTRARSIRDTLQSRHPPPPPTNLTDAILRHVATDLCSKNDS